MTDEQLNAARYMYLSERARPEPLENVEGELAWSVILDDVLYGKTFDKAVDAAIAKHGGK